jgi:phenylpropionate dioxygenase-like ring-hydroxylating dioxygenase large terminal subunit
MIMDLKKVVQCYNDNAPLEEAFTIPASWYRDPRVAELERRTVFSNNWQVAARADQIQAPGNYVTSVIGGEPVIVVRGTDGVLRAFFNVCRHHAAAVMPESCGTAAQLTCPYHGWTYSLEGELKSAPELGAVRNFDRKSNGLLPLEVTTWEAWVWVRPATVALPLKAASGVGVGDLRWFERRSYRVPCNWKVFVDNYLDGGYHVPHLHKGLNRVLDYSEYRIENGERSCLQWSPLNNGAGRALYYWIYPNFMINRYPDALDTNLVIPIGVDETEVIFDFYFKDVSDSAMESNLERIAISEAIQEEDVAICRSVQQGLASRAYSSGRLSAAREAGEHLFHRLLYSDLMAGMDEA